MEAVSTSRGSENRPSPAADDQRDHEPDQEDEQQGFGDPGQSAADDREPEEAGLQGEKREGDRVGAPPRWKRSRSRHHEKSCEAAAAGVGMSLRLIPEKYSVRSGIAPRGVRKDETLNTKGRAHGLRAGKRWPHLQGRRAVGDHFFPAF